MINYQTEAERIEALREANRRASRDYYRKNREKVIAAKKRYYWANREERAAWQRDYFNGLIDCDLYKTKEQLIEAQAKGEGEINWAAWDKHVAICKKMLQSCDQ